MTGHRVAAWDGSNAQLESAAQLYARTFTEPPYNDDVEASRTSFIERVHRHRATKPQFRLILTWEGVDLTGLVMGTGIDAGDWWRDHIVDLLTPDAQVTWLRDECFAVVELAVSPAQRRTGLARMLMDAVLKDLPYETAVLGCYSAALPARRFYASQGWVEVVADAHIDNSPIFCVLGRRLRGPTPAGQPRGAAGQE
ncbi:GNAT family N-acetyltransferase [Microbacterium sp. A93]|uniref:GNAT family N-acetyltransferase n=1 Tax=Microbacterium sp. A93 TaxID=3450716 RepID=UPI003F42569D